MDSEGNQVEVDPVDVSEGQTEVSLKFSEAVDEKDLTGVWTVDGKEYSFTVIEQFNAIMDAASADTLDELELRDALNNAGIENVDDNKLDSYATEIVNANPENLVDIQKAVNEVNATQDEEKSEQEAVEEVLAASNQVQLYQALQNNFERVNADWVVDYAQEEVGDSELLNLTKDASDNVSFDDVQGAVDNVNKQNVAEAVNAAKDSLDRGDVSEARTLVNSYLEDSKEGELGLKDYGQDNLDEIEALITVNEATTNNTLKQALVDLDELENNLVDKYEGYTKGDFGLNEAGETVIEDTIDLDAVHDDLLADYRSKLGDKKVEHKNQRSEIQSFIKEVNDSFGGFVFTDGDEGDDDNVLEVTSGSQNFDLTLQAVENDGDVIDDYEKDIDLTSVKMDEFEGNVGQISGNFSGGSAGTATINVDKKLSNLGSTDAEITFEDVNNNDYTINADIQVVAGDAAPGESTMDVNVPDDKTYTSGDEITTTLTLKDEEGNTLTQENGTHAAEIKVNGDTFYKDITFDNGSATVTVPARNTSSNTTEVTINVLNKTFTSDESFEVVAADFSELSIDNATSSGFDLKATDGVNQVKAGEKIVNVSVEDKNGNAVDISGLTVNNNTVDYQGNIKVNFDGDAVNFSNAGLDADTEYTITTTVGDVTESKTFTISE